MLAYLSKFSAIRKVNMPKQAESQQNFEPPAQNCKVIRYLQSNNAQEGSVDNKRTAGLAQVHDIELFESH